MQISSVRIACILCTTVLLFALYYYELIEIDSLTSAWRSASYSDHSHTNNEEWDSKMQEPGFYRAYYEDIWQRAKSLDIDVHDIEDDHLDAEFNRLINKSSSGQVMKRLRAVYKELFYKEPPSRYDKWLDFAIRKKCPLHPIYYAQVHKDLAPFNGSITRALVNESWHTLRLLKEAAFFKLTIRRSGFYMENEKNEH